MSYATNPRKALLALIVVTFALRVVWAALVGTGNDEAYNYLYTVYPDWSYFDHPPMTMWIDRAGFFAFGDNVHLLSLRLGYLLLFAGSTWVMYRMTARWYGEWAGFYAALALNLAFYYTAAAGVLAMPDGPFLFFALLTMWALSEALIGQPDKIRPWISVGLAWAGAMLSKYHAILLPAGALAYIIITPGKRRLLRSVGPYLATIIGFAGFTPVFIWNGQHGWASFVFQGGRAASDGFRPLGPLLMTLGAFALLAPWIWWALVKSLAARFRFASSDGIDRLLICFAAVPLGFFLLLSSWARLLLHWPLMGFLPLFCMLGQRWSLLSESRPAPLRRAIKTMSAVTLILMAVVLAQSRLGVLTFPDRDPCREFSGWDSVAAKLQALGIFEQKDAFLFTSSWDDSGQLGYSIKSKLPVLCYNSGDARGFAFWSRPEEWLGKDGYLISLDENRWEPGYVEPFFQRVELVAAFPMTRAGKPFRNVRLFRCVHQIEPFPFSYPSS